MGEVLLYVDHVGGAIHKSTLELLTLARPSASPSPSHWARVRVTPLPRAPNTARPAC